MTDLIACLSTGKGTWQEVQEVIKAENWERVFLITNDFGKENYKGEAEMILINPFSDVESIRSSIVKQFYGKKLSFEVGVNLSSGSGKEHMALIAALFELGVGMRLVSTKESQLIHL